jgi:hypothetical protein
MIPVVIALIGLFAAVALMAAERRQGVRAVRRGRLVHLLLATAVVASVLSLRAAATGPRWGLLALSASAWLVFLWYGKVVTRLPDASGLRRGRRLDQGTWRKAATGALVPVASVWGPRATLLVLYRGPW